MSVPSSLILMVKINRKADASSCFQSNSEYEVRNKKEIDVSNGPHSLVHRKGATWVQGAPEHTRNPWEEARSLTVSKMQYI